MFKKLFADFLSKSVIPSKAGPSKPNEKPGDSIPPELLVDVGVLLPLLDDGTCLLLDASIPALLGVSICVLVKVRLRLLKTLLPCLVAHSLTATTEPTLC